jgi:17beta-estradiol 17-dehydrogenase / very-long-chain 3-oxoacyl-CoA reductase
MTNCILTSLGGAVLALMIYSLIVKVILPSVLVGSITAVKRRLNSSGKAWAVVTGTTSGIGSAFVKVLAELGFNVLMIARSESKLIEIQSEMKKTARGVKVNYLVIDLAKRDILTPELLKFISSNEISILVNNAGLNTEFPKLFVDNTREEVESIIGVNTRATTLLTHAILPSMVHRRNGLVINISSLFGFLSGPLVSAYSGTKNYMDAFSLSLSEELRGSGVSVFCSLPGFVVSNMSKLKRTSLTVISPETCVRNILSQIAGGYFVVASPHWTHSLIGWAMTTILPEGVRLRILGNINRSTNKAALRKAAKLASVSK